VPEPDLAAVDTMAVVAAALLRALADALRAASLLTLSAGRVSKMALQGPLVGAVSLRATIPTACAGTDRLGSGVTTTRCGPQAMEQPLTVYWILYQLARWTPLPAVPTYSPPRRLERGGLTPTERLCAAKSRAAAAHRRAFDGLRASEGGCTRHCYHKSFPFKS
jgi:hypothetical protein